MTEKVIQLTDRKLDAQTIAKIERVLTKGDRVELIPIKEGIRVIQVKRRQIK